MASHAAGESTASPKKHHALRIVVIVALVLGIVGAGGFAAYVGDYYHADATAEAALVSTDDVQVSTLEDGDIAFVPQAPQAGIVFYPGGKVQAEAYAPLMQALAKHGFLCVITPMPFNLAVFDVNAADGVQEQFPQVHKWILMGHSLGGSMAAAYADGHDGPWAGLVLLGAYSTSDLSDNNLDILSIYGSNDGVMNRQAYEDNSDNIYSRAAEYIITGGNHAQFGNYGPQKGDGTPTISAEKQQADVADAIADYFLK